MIQSPNTLPFSINDVIDNQRVVAITLLNKLTIVDPEAMLAGGALRDWRHGKTATDLDFYLKAPNHKDKNQVEKLLQKLGCISIYKMEKGSEDVYEGIPQISSVWQATFNDEAINFIFLSNDSCGNIIYKFSNSLCECFMRVDGVTQYSSDFEKTVATKVVKLRDRYTDSHPHVKKVMNKYPEYIFIKPDTIDFNMEPPCM